MTPSTDQQEKVDAARKRIEASCELLTEMTEKSASSLYMGIYTMREANAAIRTLLASHAAQATRLEAFSEKALADERHIADLAIEIEGLKQGAALLNEGRRADALAIAAQAEEIERLRCEAAENQRLWNFAAVGLTARATSAEAQITTLRDELNSADNDISQLQHDKAAQAETIQTLKGTLEYAEDRLHEINVSNYDHDDVCRLNERSVEVIMAIRHALQDLSKALPNTGEQSQ